MHPVGLAVIDHFNVALQVAKSAAKIEGAIRWFIAVNIGILSEPEFMELKNLQKTVYQIYYSTNSINSLNSGSDHHLRDLAFNDQFTGCGIFNFFHTYTRARVPIV
jgi:hypothetical protein